MFYCVEIKRWNRGNKRDTNCRLKTVFALRWMAKNVHAILVILVYHNIRPFMLECTRVRLESVITLKGLCTHQHSAPDQALKGELKHNRKWRLMYVSMRHTYSAEPRKNLSKCIQIKKLGVAATKMHSWTKRFNMLHPIKEHVFLVIECIFESTLQLTSNIEYK